MHVIMCENMHLNVIASLNKYLESLNPIKYVTWLFSVHHWRIHSPYSCWARICCLTSKPISCAMLIQCNRWRGFTVSASKLLCLHDKGPPKEDLEATAEAYRCPNLSQHTAHADDKMGFCCYGIDFLQKSVTSRTHSPCVSPKPQCLRLGPAPKCVHISHIVWNH